MNVSRYYSLFMFGIVIKLAVPFLPVDAGVLFILIAYGVPYLDFSGLVAPSAIRFPFPVGAEPFVLFDACPFFIVVVRPFPAMEDFAFFGGCGAGGFSPLDI